LANLIEIPTKTCPQTLPHIRVDRKRAERLWSAAFVDARTFRFTWRWARALGDCAQV